jgi:acyl-ACP thioesterase
MPTSKTTFFVHSYDSDAFGHLSPVALAGYLQEAAGQSADDLGFGLRDLNRQGLTWVLVREHFELDEPVCFGDTLEVETWPSGIDRWAALRDFRLCKNQREIGRALTSWFVLDIASRHPVRPTNILAEQYRAQTPHVLPLRVGPLTTVENASQQRGFHVRFSDIDANSHVTNASYIAWVMEALAESDWRDLWLRSLDIEFLAECSLGAVVQSRSLADNEAHFHSVFREQDSKELARAVTTWRRK